MPRSRGSSGSSSSSSSSSSSDSDTHGHTRTRTPTQAQVGKRRWWNRIAAGDSDSEAQTQAGSSSNRRQAISAATKAAFLGVAQRVLPSSVLTTNNYGSTNDNDDNDDTTTNTNTGTMTRPDEHTSLLHSNGTHSDDDEHGHGHHGALPATNRKVRIVVWGVLTLLFVALLVVLVGFEDKLADGIKAWLGIMPRDPGRAAAVVLGRAPVIDGHIDLPMLLRYKYGNNISAIDLNEHMPGHVDIPRLRQGKVGGFFWSTYVSCPKPDVTGKHFLGATWKVRDTLEQIDISKLVIEKYPETFQLALSAADVKNAILNGKIASLLGVEGGHQLGNSIAVLRQYYALGVRYLTLTHTCHNAFADSCGYLPGIIPLHHGLSTLGRSLITEMNRLGMLIDLSHTSDDTALQTLNISRAPVIWSHSSARTVHDVPRNVPDGVLKLLGKEGEEGKRDGVVMINFAPFFIADPGEATVGAVADHVEHVAIVAGKEHVGLGSDFDGIGEVPEGLEDVSKYPALISELYTRGWNKYELAGLTGGNLLRVMERVEVVAGEMRREGKGPGVDVYWRRRDLPKGLGDFGEGEDEREDEDEDEEDGW